MSFLDEEIEFDVGHLILLGALILFVVFISKRCKEGMTGKSINGVQPIHWKSCRCPSCAAVALQQAEDGYLYGCNPNNPYVPYSKEECNNSYRKTMLHGCGIA